MKPSEMRSRTLADFEDPPAVETALGVKFAPIKGWDVLHYGLLSQRFKDDYPRHEFRPPVGEMTFSFSTESNFSDVPVRCWFINHDDTQLIQVQSNCFIRNWRKTDKTPDYLHYDVIRPLFERDWDTFKGFLRDEKLPAPEVWQCEVTYTNHFLRGREWNDFTNLADLYPMWKGLSREGLFAHPEMMAFSASYRLPGGDGSLLFASQPGVRKSDGQEIIQLTVTATGRPISSDDNSVLEWLDRGRAAVVSGFTNFTSDRAHKIWRMK